MKRNILCAAMVLLAGSLMAADKDDVSAAIAKLAAADNYSWKTTTTNAPPPGGGGGGGGRRGGGFGNQAVDGKAQKDGLIYTSTPGRGGTTEAYVKNGKGSMKAGEDDWTSLAETAANEDAGFNRFTAIRLQTTKSPADDAKALLEKTKGIMKMDGAYMGELTEEGAKAIGNPFGAPPAGGGGNQFQIEITGAKASVKYWVKDGVLTKYEIKASGKMQFGDQDPRDYDRTTTVEIKDVGATKIEVPAEAKKNLS